MNLFPEIKKVLTENSLIDEIIYECRQILKGIVVKDEDQALKNETLKSLRDSDIYHEIVMGTDIFQNFEYTYNTFMKLPSMTPDRAIKFAKGDLAIPDSLRPKLQQIARQEWLDNYEEDNNYYRLLAGLPPKGEEFIYLTADEYLMLPIETFDISKPVHECNESEAALLYSCGVIDSIKQRHPEAKYLDHLGDRAVDPYIARRAPNFSLLYMPPVDSPEVTYKFKYRFEINRVYALKTVYSDAYKFHSPYYDRFIAMLIIIMTFDDMIVYSPEYIIGRDLFDLRTIQYLFEACGVEFFPQIPLKYQKRLIKNLNRLIKYKSSAKCMVDIVSLFGYDNMQLFKYYLLKTPVVNEDGSYRKDTYTDPETGLEEPDLESNYELKFLKVPITEIADDYVMDPLNYKTYEETANGDIWWNGVYTPELVKHEILRHEFDLHISKYISVDTVYSMAEMQFQMVYFMNMLLYSDVNTNALLVDVPELTYSKPFKLTDLILCLFALGYMYQGIEDRIIYDPVQHLAVLGFNFNTDMEELVSFVESHGMTIEDVGLDIFINPNKLGGLRTFDQLHATYTANKYVYDKLTWLMNNANNYREYVVYEKVYQSLYVTKLSFDMFYNSSLTGKAPETYTEYLKNNAVSLYNVVLDCAAIPKEEERRLELTRVINAIVDNIYLYIDSDMFKYVFNGIPTVGLDYIRQYIFLIINFFKSYKVDVIESNIIYKFDDRMHNKVRVIDDILFKYIFNKTDHFDIGECMRLINTYLWKEDASVIDKIYLDITYWKVKHLIDDVPCNDHDHWRQIIVTFEWKDKADVRDEIVAYNHVFDWYDHITVGECMEPVVYKNPIERIHIEDTIYFVYSFEDDPIT